MKVDFTKVVLKDLSGKHIQETADLHVGIGNCIYFSAHDISMLDMAKAIYDKKEIDVTREQLISIKRLCTHEKSPLVAFVKLALNDFIDKAIVRLNIAEKKKMKK